MEGLRKTIIKVLLISMTLLGGHLYFVTPVFGVTDASISISYSPSMVLDLSFNEFNAVSQTISVTTDNYTGYTTMLTNPTNSTNLVNTINSDYTIPTITIPQGSSSIPSSQFTNGYGFSTDGTNYLSAPTTASNLLLGSRNTAGTSTHSLYFGAKTTDSTAAGVYTKTYYITALANNPQYSITYNANAGTDTVSGMPSNVPITISATGTVTLPNTVPTRTGYDFLGWDTDSTATTPSYPVADTNIIELEPTLSNEFSLFAI